MRDDIRPSEILDILKNKIRGFDRSPLEQEVGRVVQSGDGIAQVWGLPAVMASELVHVETEGGAQVSGMVMNLEEDTVGIVLFDGADLVKEGDLVKRTNRVIEVPVGDALLGRVVDPFGTPIDGKGPVASTQVRRLELKGPGIIDRQNVGEPLQTGLKAIDSMIPIGRGQRELIIGDRRTGKTTIAIDTILNQKNFQNGPQAMHCFYVAIGQKRSSVVRLVETLHSQGALAYTTVVAATASDPASLQYLAPYAATAMAEYYRDSGRHALVIFDDLTKHAQAYRELSLLMRRSPGREAFPGDIFYVHSRLLERAAKLSDARGAGSLTALPIVETQEGDVAAYIPTNVISITDGQIFLAANLFNSGLRPAVNVGISVSRVGGDAQIKAMKQAASSLRIDLAQFRELAAFMQFSSDLDPATKRQLARGERLVEILKQTQYHPLDILLQVMILKAGVGGRLDRYPLAKLAAYESRLFAYLDREGADFLGRLRAAGQFTTELAAEADQIYEAFEATFPPEAITDGIDAGFTLNLALALSQGQSSNREALNLAESLTARELSTPTLSKEIEEIMSGSDLRERDRLEELLAGCPIIDFESSSSRDDVFHEASRILGERLGARPRSLFRQYVEREDASSTAIQPFFAIPHVIADQKGAFELLVVRSRQGIHFSDKVPRVHTMFFLAGALDQRHFHLVVISALAHIIMDKSFVEAWMQAAGPEDLRPLLQGTRKR
jgi:F-type H+-transporting ATPase subunit alpha